MIIFEVFSVSKKIKELSFLGPTSFTIIRSAPVHDTITIQFLYTFENCIIKKKL